MKRAIIIFMALLLLLLCACGKDQSTVIEAEQGEGDLNEAVYYHGDENAEFLVEEKATLPENYGPQDIMNLLYENKVLEKAVGVNKWSIKDELLEIDFTEEFSEEIMGMGTAGEYIKMGSTVNSLIKNFDVSAVYITVEGNTLESGHDIYDYPLSFYEN